MAMSTAEHDHVPASCDPSGPSRPVKTALLMVVLVGGFYLLRERGDHVAGNWVYLLLLACPLMHLLHGHGGHGGHGSHDMQSNKPADKQE
jgi:hypothetical protein